jgi:hypothetical protein
MSNAAHMVPDARRRPFGVEAAPVLAADDALQEIVVTSRKRTERLQDVPEAITAVSGVP